MSMQQDFDAVTAESLQQELERFVGLCWYDDRRKKVVYRSESDALNAYMTLQREEMERHKWIESEKAHHDLMDGSLSDWVRRHSIAFSTYWKKTHLYIRPGPWRSAKVG